MLLEKYKIIQKFTIAHLRYYLEGYRPSKTTIHTLSFLK